MDFRGAGLLPKPLRHRYKLSEQDLAAHGGSAPGST
jgi:hypothetical protein